MVVDNRDSQFDRYHENELIARICDRRFGVGGDGFILLENAEGYDFRMVYYNADGYEGSMCGNGGRCIVAFAHDLGIISTQTRFTAVDGEHEATIENRLVSLKMMDVNEIEINHDHYFLDTGSPHYVRFVDNLSEFDVVQKGREIRHNDRFDEKGTNVNFVEKISDDELFVRTYERGVEDETLSCGTGVTACAMASNLLQMKVPVKIRTLGGQLEVSFSTKDSTRFKNVFLKGPAYAVFTGEMVI